MKSRDQMKPGVYFVHGYYKECEETFAKHMILLRDSMDDIYNVEAYDIAVENKEEFQQGEFICYKDGKFL